jgi:hypothetical protein
MIESAVALCSECGWSREITRAEAFNDDPVRSAKQATRGHVSACGCDYDNTDVDPIHG